MRSDFRFGLALVAVALSTAGCRGGQAGGRDPVVSLSTEGAETCVQGPSEGRWFVASAAFRNASERAVTVTSAELVGASGVTQGSALALGEEFKFDLWPLPVENDPVIERIWKARQPLRSTRIAPGATLQVGVPVTLNAQNRTGTGGPMRLHYLDGDQSLSVDGTFEYTVSLDACT